MSLRHKRKTIKIMSNNLIKFVVLDKKFRQQEFKLQVINKTR